MYSLMSMRTIAFSSSNRNSASARASSVLPTPVGPRKMNEPIGRFGSCKPARARRTAFDTAVIACFCPMTRVHKPLLHLAPASRARLRADWTPECRSRPQTTSAMSSSVTSSFSIWLPPCCISRELRVLLLDLASATAGMWPYWISLASVRSPRRCAASSSSLQLFELLVELARLVDRRLLVLPLRFQLRRSSPSARPAPFRSARDAPCSPASFSFFNACRSISSCMISRSIDVDLRRHRIELHLQPRSPLRPSDRPLCPAENGR